MRRWLGRGSGKSESPASTPAPPPPSDAPSPPSETYMKRFRQFELEEHNEVEDPRYTDEVERDLQEDEYFTIATTEEEIRENAELLESFKNSSMAKFLVRSEELAAEERARERLANAVPTRPEDAKLWKELPLVPGPYGGPPIPRKSLRTDEEVQGRFWDFFKQFEFGLWGYRQRPYPELRPIDVQQVLGYKWLDKRYADFTMRAGGWYYKDRLGRTRGPMELINLKTAWAAGIVDKNTFIWGDDMDEWAPIGMVYGLQSAVETPDLKVAAMGSALVHKLARGLSPWTPLKGHSIKSYKQIQAEAIEKREREKAVLRQNHGSWPGESTPSHAMFLWAGGAELTDLLEQGNKKNMPHKFISYENRKELAKQIPGLRPWEVLEVEQVMDLVTYNKEWYREDLGEFTTRADYERDWFESFQEKWDEITEDIETVFGRGEEADKAR